MVKIVVRVIPIVLVNDGYVVLSNDFNRFRIQGHPTQIIDRLCTWDSDEIFILNVSRSKGYESAGVFRNDSPLFFTEDLVEISTMCSRFALTPLAIGGGIRDLGQIESLLRSGADKVVLNSTLYTDAYFCQRAISTFGGSTIVASIDYRKVSGTPRVFVQHGAQSTSRDLFEYLLEFDSWGFSEFLVNSIDRDGAGIGFDIEVGEELCSTLRTPVVICGGAGRPSDFEEAVGIPGISGVAAANYFHFQENSMLKLKSYLRERELSIRSPEVSNRPRTEGP